MEELRKAVERKDAESIDKYGYPYLSRLILYYEVETYDKETEEMIAKIKRGEYV